MNTADRRSVVVDESEEVFSPATIDDDFFESSRRIPVVGIAAAASILLADVAADADRAELPEARFSVRTSRAGNGTSRCRTQHDIRNELLEFGIGLDLGRAEREVGRVEDRDRK